MHFYIYYITFTFNFICEFHYWIFLLQLDHGFEAQQSVA